MQQGVTCAVRFQQVLRIESRQQRPWDMSVNHSFRAVRIDNKKAPLIAGLMFKNIRESKSDD